MLGEKYLRLAEHLAAVEPDRVTLSFAEVESILGFPLPPSASRYQEWWYGRTAHCSQESAWLSAGWHVKQVGLAARRVSFARGRD